MLAKLAANRELLKYSLIFIRSWMTDLAYRILLQHEALVASVDEHGLLPLNLIADKPAAFRSGCHLGWWKEIMYHC